MQYLKWKSSKNGADQKTDLVNVVSNNSRAENTTTVDLSINDGRVSNKVELNNICPLTQRYANEKQ